MLTCGGVKWFEPFTFVLPLGCLHSNDALWFLSSLFLVNVIFFIVNRRLSGIVRMLAWGLSIFMGDICFVKLQ